MDFCTNIEALRKELINIVNGSGLTIGAAYLVVKDVYNMLYLSYLEEIEAEKHRNLNPQHEEKIIPAVMPEESKEEMENGEQNND